MSVWFFRMGRKEEGGREVCTSAAKGIAMFAAVITAGFFVSLLWSGWVRGGGAYGGGRCRIGVLCVRFIFWGIGGWVNGSG